MAIIEVVVVEVVIGGRKW